MAKRGSGILLHITSLPSNKYGIGDFGPGAYKFADFLFNSRQKFWQVLPLNPIDPAQGNSPYSSISAFAGNTLLISPDILAKEDMLDKTEIDAKDSFNPKICDYSRVIPYKEGLLRNAYKKFKKSKKGKDEYQKFCSRHSYWLDDFALFVIIKRLASKKAWSKWLEGLRDRKAKALKEIKVTYGDDIEKERFLQYIFFKQWVSLKKYCNAKGIRLIGDIPLYVSHDCADVWTHTNIFKLDKNKEPKFLAGVPPDYFSKTGQLWGHPTYNWREISETGYRWWIERLRHNFSLFDMLRIDHFRGLAAFWEIPAGEKTAVNGKWLRGPGAGFFTTLKKRFARFPVIAEDLGTITHDVHKLRERFNIPGMRVLLFAFGEDNPRHPYLPENYVENCIVYTGTHDNNTVRGWFEHESSPEDRKRLFRYIGREVRPEDVNWEFIRLAMGSKADIAIIPMQDILGLGQKARMNLPATLEGNWQWRLLPEELSRPLEQKLAKIAYDYERT